MESSGASGALQERGQMRYFSICVMTCIAILIYSSNPSYALDVTLARDANTEPDLAGYGIYYDTDSGDPYYGTGASDGDSPVDIRSADLFYHSFCRNGRLHLTFRKRKR